MTMVRIARGCVGVLALGLLAALPVAAQAPEGAESNWHHWRGPNRNGVANTDAPTVFSATEHVKWKTAIPGRGFSSPIVWGDRLFLTTAIIPFEVYMIPLYFQVKALGALNSITGLLIGYLVMSFGIFLIRQNVIASIPDELLEAARIDGAGEFWIFRHIVVPLLRGPLAALAVLAFFQAWTAFAWPIITLTRKTSFTIEVGLANFQSAYTVELSLLSAASAAVMVPSVLAFVLLRRNFVEGIAASGMKE